MRLMNLKWVGLGTLLAAGLPALVQAGEKFDPSRIMLDHLKNSRVHRDTVPAEAEPTYLGRLLKREFRGKGSPQMVVRPGLVEIYSAGEIPLVMEAMERKLVADPREESAEDLLAKRILHKRVKNHLPELSSASVKEKALIVF